MGGLRYEALDINIATMGLAALMITVRPLIFIFMLNIVMSILGIPFAQLKEGAR